MASNAEMFQFIANFGPMVGELAARLEFLEARIEALEGGFTRAAPGAVPAADDGPGEEAFEIAGHKFDMKSMLEAGMPAGGVGGIMERLKNWKPTAAAPTPPTAPAAAAPTSPSSGTGTPT